MITPQPTRVQRMHGMGYSVREIKRLTGYPMHRILEQLRPYLKPKQLAAALAKEPRTYTPPEQFVGIDGIPQKMADALRHDQPADDEEADFTREVWAAATRIKEANMRAAGLRWEGANA